MNHEQLLNDFVDGTIDYQGEATLFAELHLNEGLRGDFKTLLLMQRGVRHDMAAYFPPAASTNEIFQRLGFAAEGMESEGMVIAGGTWFGRVLHGLAGGIVGALLMLGLVIWQPDLFPIKSSDAAAGGNATAGTMLHTPDARSATDGDANGSANGNTTSAAQSSIATPETLRGMNGAGRHPSEEIIGTEREDRTARRARGNDTRSNDARSRRTMATTPSIAEPEIEQHSTTSEIAPPIAPVELIAPESSPAMPDQQPVPSSTAHRAIDGNTLPDPWDSPSLIDRMPLSIEIRALESRSFARIPGALNHEPTTLLRNMAIGVRYDIDGTHGIGVEFGQEMFYQKFIVEEQNGDLVQHQQNPLLPWAGVIYRYDLYSSSGLNPYLQGLLGATQVGPIARAMAGAYYQILPELYLSGGVEVSGVGYSVGGTEYSSWKYGVTYGMSVNF